MKALFLFLSSMVVLAGCAETQTATTVAPSAPAAASASLPPDLRHRPGYATYWSGDQLWEACGKDSDATPPEACRTYILGVSDGHNSAYARKGMLTLYCLTLFSTGDNLTTVVRTYMKAHPERRKGSAASLVLRALALGFPCNREE